METDADAGAPLAMEPRAPIYVPRVTIGAFAASEETRRMFKLVGADRRMANASFATHDGGIGQAIEFNRQSATPDLLIIEFAGERREMFASLAELAEFCPPETVLLLIGRDNDVGVYRALLRDGVSEYLIAPVAPLDLMSAISDLFGDGAKRSMGRMSAFVGAKGGCGSSTVAQNVAWSIANHFDTSVLLIDLDLALGACALQFAVDPDMTVVNALGEGDRLDRAVLERMVMKIDRRLALLASPADLMDICAQDLSAFRRLIDAARATAAHVVLDLPSGWTSYTSGLAKMADEIVVTATPDLASLRNAGAMINQLKAERPNDLLPRLVLNRLDVPRAKQIEPDKFAAAIKTRLTARVPFDPAAFSAAESEGVILCKHAQGSVAAAQMDAIASLLTGQVETKSSAARRPAGMMGFLRKAGSR